MDKDYSQQIREYILKKIFESKEKDTKFETPEFVSTSTIGHSDIINQVNNIGSTINDNVKDSSDSIHKKLDKISEQTASKKDENMPKDISINDYILLKEDIREIKTSINWLKWLVPIFVTIGIFISGLIVNSIKENSNTQFKMLEQKLDTIKETNSMQIQRDVAIEIKNQTNNK